MRPRDLRTRVERLEQQAAPDSSRLPAWAPANPRGPWHTVIQDIGETEAEARVRYERETGNRIADGDGVILRELVAGINGRPATSEEARAIAAQPSHKPHRYGDNHRRPSGVEYRLPPVQVERIMRARGRA